MKYARIIDNVAIEVFKPQEGFTLAESFHPDIAALFSEVPDAVTANSAKNEDGTWNIFDPTVVPATPAPAKGEVQQAPNVTN
jgi:hypothetical protein